ncbi:hypothetical protein E2C01_076520 [Portunus trituberculatus]|uniref:Uncharacterized protein n=1 Tax=Portunus trituberculatus TaxID=210409 RepID=A0A5B7IDE9_PORTR|nr:hypothetical protein [Portunus trituberculatus]
MDPHGAFTMPVVQTSNYILRTKCFEYQLSGAVNVLKSICTNADLFCRLNDMNTISQYRVTVSRWRRDSVMVREAWERVNTSTIHVISGPIGHRQVYPETETRYSIMKEAREGCVEGIDLSSSSSLPPSSSFL